MEKENKRRLFLSQACLPVLISVLGIPIVNGCVMDSNDEDFINNLDDDNVVNDDVSDDNVSNYNDDDDNDDDDDHDDNNEDHDDDDDDDDDDDHNNNSNNNQNGGDSLTGDLVIDLSETTFNDLKNVGGWMNYTAKNLLLIRVNETNIRAFNNACPHEGIRNRWTFDGTKFQCHEHNRTYNNNCSGSLLCYDTVIEGNTLTVSVGN